MAIAIYAKKVSSYTTEQIQQMERLSYKEGLLRFCLRSYHRNESIAAICTNNAGKIVGWAGVRLMPTKPFHGSKALKRAMRSHIVGVFVDHRYRRRGLARILMSTLLRRLAKDRPNGLVWSDPKIRRWVAPIVRGYGLDPKGALSFSDQA